MSALLIVLRGYPERVQQIADAIDSALPGTVSWVQVDSVFDGVSIQIEGQHADRTFDVAPLPFEAWTDFIADVEQPA